MEKYLTKLKKIIDKIGKQNFFLIVFILITLGLTGLYQTFSLYTASNGVSILDDLKTYTFILSNNEENTITIAAGNSKKMMMTITNSEEKNLKYGIYYSSSSDLSNVSIGYLPTTNNLPKGIIEGNTSYVVSLQIDNNSTSDVTISFGVKYGFITGGELVKADNQYWLEEKIIYLNSVKPGSYVSYMGNNGCDSSTGACVGRNANYTNDTNRGYCGDSTYKFTENGWKLAYIQDDIPYLISGGSPECMCTSSDGTSSNSSCEGYESIDGVPSHLSNLKEISLKYCNINYAWNRMCNDDSAWAMNETDFENIVNSGNNLHFCKDIARDVNCGYKNKLIDNGSYYWNTESASDFRQYTIFAWNPELFWFGHAASNAVFGVRPVLKLRSDIEVVGGDGTYKKPYRITPNELKIIDLSGWGNHGINYGATLDNTNGTVTTNGSNTYVDAGLTNYDFGSSITLVARIKINSFSSGNSLLGNWENGGGGIYASASYSNTNHFWFNFHIDGSYRNFHSTYVPSLNTWYTVVATYDGTNLAMYVNGTATSLDTSVSGSTNSVSGKITVSSMPFHIGNNPSPLGTLYEPASATYDSVLIFDRALPAEEIAKYYSGEITTIDEKDLLVYYNFK